MLAGRMGALGCHSGRSGVERQEHLSSISGQRPLPSLAALSVSARQFLRGKFGFLGVKLTRYRLQLQNYSPIIASSCGCATGRECCPVAYSAKNFCNSTDWIVCTLALHLL